ncbi:hypothetical protein [Candidatus Hakubella thermalkaliphila]|nr:hypothetical protein [Candidatus Hakubella thermalkaliphila]
MAYCKISVGGGFKESPMRRCAPRRMKIVLFSREEKERPQWCT